jgi:hypothetical protein
MSLIAIFALFEPHFATMTSTPAFATRAAAPNFALIRFDGVQQCTTLRNNVSY